MTPAPTTPAPTTPAPTTPEPYAFGWDPFGDEWNDLFDMPDVDMRGMPPEAADALRQMQEQMRAEMREMRQGFLHRMQRPRIRTPALRAPALPPQASSPPGSGAPGVTSPSPERPAPQAQPRTLDISRVDGPDATVFIVRGEGLVDGSLRVKVDGDSVVISASLRDPDGVERRISRALTEEVGDAGSSGAEGRAEGHYDAKAIDIRHLDGGYRVVLPYAHRPADRHD